MKTKLCLAVVVGVLLSLLAFPVLAGTDDIPMWVSHARLAWTGRSSTGTDAVVGLIHVRDAEQQNVPWASVTVRWTLNGQYLASETVLTSRRGLATTSIWAGPGVYRLYVTNVTKTGWVYYPTVIATPTYPVY